MKPAANIFAELTAPGRGGISTLALRGPEVGKLLSRLLRSRAGLPEAGRIVYGHVVDEAGRAIDEVLVRRAASEEFEIHCHGGPASVAALAARLEAAGISRCGWTDYVVARASALNDWAASRGPSAGHLTHLAPKQPGVKVWHPGSVQSTKIAAEAELIVPHLATLRAALVVLDQAGGALARAWREAEELVGGAAAPGPAGTVAVSAARELLDRLIAAYENCGRWVERAPRVAIVGRANVGKSSLMNAIVGQERAIVTPLAGTTRDVVTELAALDGLPVVVADTAGLREAGDAVEQLGVERARGEALAADVVVYVVDLTDRATAGKDAATNMPAEQAWHRVLVGSKADLAGTEAARAAAVEVATSAVTGEGLDRLAELVLGRLGFRWPKAGAAVPFTRGQAEALRGAKAALERGEIGAAGASLRGWAGD